MANLRRKIGVNIFSFMQRNGISPEEFADKMKYSVRDVWRIIEGKVMVPPVEIDKIVMLLGISKKELISFNADTLAPNLAFMNEFSDPNNLDKILDLMDEYVEIKESI